MTAEDPRLSYWRSLHQRGDLSAVGQSGLPDEMNRWLYRTLERNVDRFLVREDLVVPERVFDVGSGRGTWVAHWLARGAGRVDGCDLVPEAVALLEERFGASGHFGVADIASTVPGPVHAYQFVSCMNVLLHLIDDEAFERGARHVARLVAAGGSLLLCEPLARTPRPRGADGASVARTIDAYRRPVEAEGLDLVALGGSSAFGNNPIEGGPTAPLWRTWWALVRLGCRISPANARWLGPLAYALDGLAVPRGASPSGKLALFRRPR